MPERRRRIDWAAIAARARLHPNTWTQAAMMNRNNAAHIRSGRLRHFQPADEWAARYERSDTPGLVLVYVMYLGKKP